MKKEIINIFVVYSHADETHKEQLLSHLAPIIDNNLDVWCDSLIKAGDFWENEISKKLLKANIIILLVSSDFYKSVFIQTVELGIALENHQKGLARILPIKVRSCNDSNRLKPLHFLPRKGKAKPIVEWRYRDQAWKEVVDEINDIIRNRMDSKWPIEKMNPPILIRKLKVAIIRGKDATIDLTYLDHLFNAFSENIEFEVKLELVG